MWLPACGLSSNTAGNGWPEGPPCSSPALLLQCSLDPAFSCQELWFPAKSQGKAEVLKSCNYWQDGFLATSSTFASILASCPPSYSTHFELISPVFCCCILSFPCSCIIQLSFSGSVFAPPFSPLSSPCSMYRRKTASCAIQPCVPRVMTE